MASMVFSVAFNGNPTTFDGTSRVTYPITDAARAYLDQLSGQWGKDLFSIGSIGGSWRTLYCYPTPGGGTPYGSSWGSDDFSFRLMQAPSLVPLPPKYKPDPSVFAREAARHALRGMIRAALAPESSFSTRFAGGLGIAAYSVNQFSGMLNVLSGDFLDSFSSFLGLNLGQGRPVDAPSSGWLIYLDGESVSAPIPTDFNPPWSADDPNLTGALDSILGRLSQIAGNTSAVAEDIARISDYLSDLINSEPDEKTSDKSNWVGLIANLFGSLAEMLGKEAASVVSGAISDALSEAAGIGAEAIDSLFRTFSDILEAAAGAGNTQSDEAWDSRDMKLHELFTLNGVNMPFLLSEQNDLIREQLEMLSDIKTILEEGGGSGGLDAEALETVLDKYLWHEDIGQPLTMGIIEAVRQPWEVWPEIYTEG